MNEELNSPNQYSSPIKGVDRVSSDKDRGLYRKFEVTRTDGSSASGQKHCGCEYFVIDLTHDEFATVALTAYADACQDQYPVLAADLRRRIADRQPLTDAGKSG